MAFPFDLRAAIRPLLRKRIVLVSGVTLAVVLVSVVVIRLLMYRSASYSGTLHATVDGPMEIQRDSAGVPTVRSQSWKDAYWAVGYLHARDRLIQIEYYRSMARGTLSEIMGEETLVIDRVSRIIGYTKSAEILLERLGAPYKEYLEAYAAGINLAKRKMYREVTRVSHVPRGPWSAADVLAILLMTEWNSAFLNNRELSFPLPEKLRQNALSDIIPGNLLYWYPDSEQKNVFVLKELKKYIKKWAGCPPSGFAVYLSKYHTSDGKAKTLCNLDGSLQVFPVWFPVRLHVKDRHVEGVTMAGIPFVLIGKNRDMSFANFPVRADTQDFIIETVQKDGNGGQYLSGGVWKDFTARGETIRVGRSGRTRELPLTVRSTEHGPVISDAFRDLYKTDTITVRMLPVSEKLVTVLFEVPALESLQNIRNLVTGIACHPRVFLFGAWENGLKIYAGRLPVRNFQDTLFKKDAYIPPAGDGYDLSVYTRQEDTDVMVVGDSIFEDPPAILRDQIVFRDRVRLEWLKELIRRNDSIDVSYLKSLLKDTHSTAAFKYVPLFIKLLEKIPVTSARLARIYFHDWDMRLGVNSIAATVFESIYTRLLHETLGDELRNELPDVLEHFELISDRFFEAFTQDKSAVFDDITTSDRTETRDMIFDRSFLKAMRIMHGQRGPTMEDWEWGTVHTGVYGVPMLKKESLLYRRYIRNEKIPLEGGIFTIYKGGFSIDRPFTVDMITSLSAVFDADTGVIGMNHGYSDNPFSEYYGNIRVLKMEKMNSPAKHVLKVLQSK